MLHLRAPSQILGQLSPLGDERDDSEFSWLRLTVGNWRVARALKPEILP